MLCRVAKNIPTWVVRVSGAYSYLLRSLEESDALTWVDVGRCSDTGASIEYLLRKKSLEKVLETHDASVVVNTLQSQACGHTQTSMHDVCNLLDFYSTMDALGPASGGKCFQSCVPTLEKGRSRGFHAQSKRRLHESIGKHDLLRAATQAHQESTKRLLTPRQVYERLAYLEPVIFTASRDDSRAERREQLQDECRQLTKFSFRNFPTRAPAKRTLSSSGRADRNVRRRTLTILDDA